MSADAADTGDRATPRSLGNGGSRPVPDPTELTDRAIAKVEDSITVYIDGKVEVLAERIKGATALTDERFEAAEKLRIEQKNDTKAAVDAALAAAKEAVKEQTTASERSIDKSEKATGETLRQMAETFQKTTEGLSDKIDDLKERIGRMESVKIGGQENRTATFAVIGLIVTIVLASLTVIGFVLANAPRPV